MENPLIRTLLFATFLVGLMSCAMADETTLPLAGTWRFRLDPEDIGVDERWFALELEDTVQLPGA